MCWWAAATRKKANCARSCWAFAEPRFGTAIIDERDLAGIADANDELDRVVSELLARRQDIKLLFLVGSCPSEVIKLDLSRAAERLSRQHMPQTRVLSYSGSGIETTFTQGVDACLAALVPTLAPRSIRGKHLLIVGTLADVVEDQLGAMLRKMGIEQFDFFPPRRRTGLPAVGPETVCMLAQPFLADTAKQLESMGIKRLGAPFPLGAEGATQWLQVAAHAFGIDAKHFENATRAPRQRAEQSVARHRVQLEGKSISFLPDSQLEIPLARFVFQELHMKLLEVGTPYIHRQIMAPELEQLPSSTRLSEGQSLELQLDRCNADRPDLIVCGLGLATFSELCVSRKPEDVLTFVEGLLLNDVNSDSIFLNLIAPAARHLGLMWEQERADFTQVTMGLLRMHQITHLIGYEYQSGPQKAGASKRVTLASAPGSQHILGLAMVSEFFRKSGWQVVVEIATTPAELYAAAKNEWFDLIGLSVGLTEQLTGLLALVTTLKQKSRNANIPILLGGPAFLSSSFSAQSLGADAITTDALEGVQIASMLVDN